MLEVRQLSVHYGGVRALSEVDLRVGPGEVIGLMGANGAGKTTCIDAITGFAAARGEVLLDGQQISKLPAHRRALVGLARTWQGGELFEDLSVRDNLRLGLEPVTLLGALADGFRPRRRLIDERIGRVIERLGLTAVANELPGEISQGQRKLVGVGRALVMRPKILLLDEPAAGLSTTESRRLGAVIRDVAASGIGVLLVEHDTALVLSISDRIYVLDRGSLLAEGTPAEVRRNERVIAAYLGPNAIEVQQ